jgi:hypothetical protein
MQTLSRVQIVGAIHSYLVDGGYEYATDIDGDLIHGALEESLRVYESRYSVIAVAYYETWTALESRWVEAQSLLVDLITKYFRRGEAKAWEGYLVLLTQDQLLADPQGIDRIRRDTTRLRKIVIAGADTDSLENLQTALLPVLPLNEVRTSLRAARVMDRLPTILGEFGIDVQLSQEVVRAFERNHSPMEAIWKWRSGL